MTYAVRFAAIGITWVNQHARRSRRHGSEPRPLWPGDETPGIPGARDQGTLRLIPCRMPAAGSGQTDVLGGYAPCTRPSSQALLRVRRLVNPRSIAAARHGPELSRVLARHRRYGQELEGMPGEGLSCVWRGTWQPTISPRSQASSGNAVHVGNPGQRRCPGTGRESVVGLGKKAKDKAKVVKGKAKKQAGKATGNKRLKAKGRAGEATGKLKLKGRKAKNASKR